MKTSAGKPAVGRLLLISTVCITAIPDKWKRAALKLDSNSSEQKLKRTAENS